jgi:tetratricopeptide (TPR) repeat protein
MERDIRPHDAGGNKRKELDMKRIILAAIGLSALVGVAMFVDHSIQPRTSHEEPGIQPAAEQSPETAPAPESVPASKPQRAKKLAELAESSDPLAPTASAHERQVVDSSAVKYSVDVLVSPQSTWVQKQAAWKQLRDSGKLDRAIGDLEQRTGSDPNNAANSAALGQAYLQKCGAIKDVREQGILGMQADKAFDNALSLDPSNWEARFNKAMALSYWPESMKKGPEVVENFQMLIQQQESQAPQPQFAETYLWLGDQYQKAGQTDDARAAWQRGASLFPGNERLQSRLSPAK